MDFGDGFGVLMEERTIHVYLSIDLCKAIPFICLWTCITMYPEILVLYSVLNRRIQFGVRLVDLMF